MFFFRWISEGYRKPKRPTMAEPPADVRQSMPVPCVKEQSSRFALTVHFYAESPAIG